MADRLWQILMEAKVWQSDSYICPKMAAHYNRLDTNGRNTGNNLVNLDGLRVIRWIGVEPSVTVPGRKRKVTRYGYHSLRQQSNIIKITGIEISRPKYCVEKEK